MLEGNALSGARFDSCALLKPFNKASFEMRSRTGELPLEIIRMKAKGCSVLLDRKGFMLPSNIGELGDDIVELDLRECPLRGTFV